MGMFDSLRRAYELVQQARALGDTPNNLIPARTVSTAGSFIVDNDTALKSSAVWACLRTRADMVSTMPLQVKRTMPDGSVQVVSDPRLSLDLFTCDLEEAIYSTQMDLDLTGNAFGLILSRDPISMRPTLIEPVPATKVTVSKHSGQVTYRIGGTTYQPDDVWHERQFTVSGSPVGLSPLQYAAMSIGQNMSALQLGLDYFHAPGLPTAHIKNTKKVLTSEQAEEVKRRYVSAMRERGAWVTGADWDIDIQSLKADESQFLQTMEISAADICRFFGCPPDLVGVNASGENVTYANITQRFLEFLVANLQPALTRRERTFSRRLLPNKVFAKFDANEILRLDPVSQAATFSGLIAARVLSPDEVRRSYELAPLTPEQTDQIHDLIASAPVATPIPPAPKIYVKPEA